MCELECTEEIERLDFSAEVGNTRNNYSNIVNLSAFYIEPSLLSRQREGLKREFRTCSIEEK